jgi:hypothetical protein
VSKNCPQQQVSGNPAATNAGTPNGEDRRELGCLLREAARLLEATDLSGANETLKAAEEVLSARGAVNVDGFRR